MESTFVDLQRVRLSEQMLQQEPRSVCSVQQEGSAMRSSPASRLSTVGQSARFFRAHFDLDELCVLARTVTVQLPRNAAELDEEGPAQMPCALPEAKGGYSN